MVPNCNLLVFVSMKVIHKSKQKFSFPKQVSHPFFFIFFSFFFFFFCGWCFEPLVCYINFLRVLIFIFILKKTFEVEERDFGF